jgi:hypothetical protein
VYIEKNKLNLKIHNGICFTPSRILDLPSGFSRTRLVLKKAAQHPSKVYICPDIYLPVDIFR